MLIIFILFHFKAGPDNTATEKINCEVHEIQNVIGQLKGQAYQVPYVGKVI